MIANPWLVASTVIVIGLPAYANNEQSWQGYLIDRSCRASMEGDSNTLNFVKAQTRDCALMLTCKKAGYALFTKGAGHAPKLVEI